MIGARPQEPGSVSVALSQLRADPASEQVELVALAVPGVERVLDEAEGGPVDSARPATAGPGDASLHHVERW
ncbi:MAG: hypothetical protein M3350_09160 [Actinomycetota bacterium]|nr:hypothetical protein [Actinomycetota bacterium]